MAMATLDDGTKVHCLLKSEAIVLDSHVEGYFGHGIDIGPGDVVFDVGANIGVFGVRAVQKHPDVRVFAFEPVPEIFDTLQKNSELHGDGRLVPLPYGASDALGSTAVQYYPKSPAMSTAHPEFWDDNPGMLASAVAGAIANAPKRLWYARLVPSGLSKWLAKRLRSGAITVTCELRTISSVIREYQLERVDLLKIDCEGAEFLAMTGIDEEHWPRIGKVIAEVHDVDGRLDKVIALLEKHGLSRIEIEKEAGFEDTVLHNVHAIRPASATDADKATADADADADAGPTP